MPQILVEFVSDTSQLTSSFDQLAKDGKISGQIAEEMKKAQKEIDNWSKKVSSAGKATKKDFQELAAVLKKAPKELTANFGKDFENQLKAMGVSVEEFTASLEDHLAAQRPLREEVRALKEEMALMALEGRKNTAEFEALSQKAGDLQNAIDDAGEGIKRFASDTRSIDTAIGAVSGITAAFSIATSAQALLGEEGEEYQKTLLKVQAAMGLLQGVQQIQLLLEKESAVMIAITNVRRKAAIAATNLQSAAESRFILIRWAAVAAQKALNLVMAANPAGLVLTAIAGLAAALTFFSKESKTAADRTLALNEQLMNQLDFLERLQKSLNKPFDLRIKGMQDELALMQASGASRDAILQKEKEIAEQQKEQASFNKGFLADEISKLGMMEAELEIAGERLKAEQAILALDPDNEKQQKNVEALKSTVDYLLRAIGLAENAINDARTSTNEVAVKEAEIQKKAMEDALKSAKGFADGKVALTQEGSRKELQARIEAIHAATREELANVDLTAGERFRIQQTSLRAIRDLEYDWATKRLQAAKDGLEAEAILAQDNSEKQFDKQLEMIYAQEKIELREKGLTEEKKRLIIAKTDKAIEQMNKDRNTRILEKEKDLLKSQTDQINLTFKEREDITLKLLEKERELELFQVVNNKEKEAEINARYDKQIAETKKQLRTEALEYELRLEEINAQAIFRGLERTVNLNKQIADDSKRTFGERTAALEKYQEAERNLINEAEARDLEANGKRQEHTRDLYKNKSISQQEYTLKMKELTDEEVKISEDAEDKRTENSRAGVEARKELLLEEMDFYAQWADGIVQAFMALADVATEAALAQLETEKEKLDQFREAGAITEKEYRERMKRIEQEEKRIKTEQAKREKAYSLFTALVQGAKAIVEAAPNPILIALTSALVAAQVAAIIAKPIPKFGTGTKKAPKGFAQVGETGAEIIQNEKGYYLASHPQVIWLKGGERIYNPRETKELLRTPRASEALLKAAQRGRGSAKAGMSPQALARAIGNEIAKHPKVSLNVDARGFTTAIEEHLSKTNYLNQRYRYDV